MNKKIKVLSILSTILVAFFLFSCNTVKTDTYLVDVRTPEEYAEGTIKGAVNIPLNDLDSKIGDLKGKTKIMVFCRSGARSSAATELLKSNGITNVIDGGGIENAKKLVNQ